MRGLIVFSVVIAAAYGVGVKWTDLRVGNVALPTKETDAKHAYWEACGADDTLKITWYKKAQDTTLSLAYDERGNCAGVRITVLKSAIDSNFLSAYTNSKGIYKSTTVNGKAVFTSTVLFTDPKILKSGGRVMQKGEEVALGVYVEVGGTYTRVSREGCTIATTFQEQSCQPKYGVIFSSFKETSSCSNIVPLQFVSDPAYDGDLTGFGWLSFHQVSGTESFKTVSKDHVKTLFPHSPRCLSESAKYATVNIWLSYSDSLEATCSNSNWVSTHCKQEVSKRTNKKTKDKSSSSSSSSDSSDSSD